MDFCIPFSKSVIFNICFSLVFSTDTLNIQINQKSIIQYFFSVSLTFCIFVTSLDKFKKFCTSSFKMRPPLPVPIILFAFKLCIFNIFLTAGVAKNLLSANFPLFSSLIAGKFSAFPLFFSDTDIFSVGV